MIKQLLMTTTFFISAHVIAESKDQWIKYTGTTTNSFYINPSRIMIVDGGKNQDIELWEKMIVDKETPGHSYKVGMMALSKNQIRCSNSTYRNISLIWYNVDGSLIKEHPANYSAAWSDLVPDSVVDIEAKLVCPLMFQNKP